MGISCGIRPFAHDRSGFWQGDHSRNASGSFYDRNCAAGRPELWSAVGTSKRHAHRIDRGMGERADTAATSGVEPAARANVELELDPLPLTKIPRPPGVRAWVRDGAVAIRVEASAVAWTLRAVALEWTNTGGQV